MSTLARLRQFVHDFRASEGDSISVRYEAVEGKNYAVLRYADLCDFLAKKDYTSSWYSEMHERFCFFDYDDWNHALQKVGFILADGSTAKQNPWLIEHRFAPAGKVYTKNMEGKLLEHEQPVTNVLIFAGKPE